MANKRRLKKSIKYACGDIAGECLLTRVYTPGVDSDQMNGIILSVAQLQGDMLDKASFAFDKTRKSFPNGADYSRARRRYYRQAYGKLLAEFNKGVAGIVDRMNAALPDAQKELNKKG